MTTVKKASGTTLTLFVFIAAIIALTKSSTKWNSEFVYQMDLILSSEYRLGTVHSATLKISFWALLIASAIDAIYRDKKGLAVLSAFGIPIFFSGGVAVWALILNYTCIDLRWFWLSYYAMIHISTKLSFKKLSKAKGGGPDRIADFFKTPPSKYDRDVDILDRYVLFLSKFVLLALLLLQIIMIIVFCIQHQEIFAFF